MYIESVFFILIALAVSPLYENENIDVGSLFEKASESSNNLKFNDAISYLDEILKYDPDNTLALNNKGGVLMQLEKYDDALLYFEKAIEINPDFVEAINNKAAALYNLDRNVDALSTFYDAYKIDPHDKVIVENMASINDEIPFVREISYATIEIRNSDDQLVGYTESHALAFKHPLALMFLEDNAERISVEINGEEFELLKYSVNYLISEPGLSSTTSIALIEKDSAYGVYVIRIEHDGFLTVDGDNAHVTVFLLRPS